MTNSFTEYKPSIVSDIVELVVILIHGFSFALTFLHHHYFQAALVFIIAVSLLPNLRIVATRSLRVPVTYAQVAIFVIILFGVLGAYWTG